MYSQHEHTHMPSEENGLKEKERESEKTLTYVNALKSYYWEIIKSRLNRFSIDVTTSSYN